MSECVCSGPGKCPRFSREMTERTWELCSGNCPPERPCPEDVRLPVLEALAGKRLRLAPASAFDGTKFLTCRNKGDRMRGPDGKTVKAHKSVG